MSDEITLKIPLAEVTATLKTRDLFYQRYPFGDLVCIVKIFHKDYKSPRRRRVSYRSRPALSNRTSPARQLSSSRLRLGHTPNR